jgi:hypothetical protein
VEKRKSAKEGRIEGNVVNDRRGLAILAFILPFCYGYNLMSAFPPSRMKTYVHGNVLHLNDY